MEPLLQSSQGASVKQMRSLQRALVPQLEAELSASPRDLALQAVRFLWRNLRSAWRKDAGTHKKVDLPA